MASKISSYKQNLLRISEGLSDEDLTHMLFLCGDIISRQDRDAISAGHELFQVLEERRKLDKDNTHFLADLLHEIGQEMLLDYLDTPSYSGRQVRCQLKLARVFVKNIGMELDEKDFQSLKSACEIKREEISNFYELIGYLETRKKIKIKYKVELDYLIEAIKKAFFMQESNKVHVHFLIEEFLRQNKYEETCYRMTSNPKGLCVIINNVKFKSVERTRHGSKMDRDLLKRLFRQFKYDVRVFNDLTSDKIIERLGEISLEDHWLYDCFICCMLSHGSLGSVFGVNDVAVPIKDILNLFSIDKCPSLGDKPKVFFFQACQGQQRQIGSYSSSYFSGSGLQVETRSMTSGVQETGGMESDALMDEEPPSPSDLEPDLLLGYATPPGFKSYRDVNQGSWYINELVNNLQRLAATEDILNILTKVNDDVAKKEGYEDSVSVKQTPCPTFTLKKKLYLATPADTGISLS